MKQAPTAHIKGPHLEHRVSTGSCLQQVLERVGQGSNQTKHDDWGYPVASSLPAVRGTQGGQTYPVITAHHDTFIWGRSWFLLLIGLNWSVLTHIVACILSLQGQHCELTCGSVLQQVWLASTAVHLLPRIMHGQTATEAVKSGSSLVE